MSNGPELRQQLQSLTIPKEQRPGGRDRPAAGGAYRARRGGWGKWVVVLLLVIAGGIYLYRDSLGSVGNFANTVGEKIESVAQQASPAPQVKLISVLARAASGPEAAFTATGKIYSDHIVSVSTKVSGQVITLHFEQGNVVKQGELLAELENINFVARRDQAQAMLSKAKATAEYEELNYSRMKGLESQEVSRPIEMANAKRALEEARAQVKAEEAQLAFVEKALRDTRVVAPISGTILERNVEVGDFVAAEGGRGMMANSQFTRIADMSMLRVEVDVNELDITRLFRDMPCRIVPDAYKDRTYKGHILWIDPGANYSKATVQVKVRIDKPDEFLRIEGTAKVAFFKDDPDKAAASDSRIALWIPKSAFQTEPDGKSAHVFLASNRRLKRTPITIGQMTPTEVEVTDGLKSGDQIATESLDKLKDGQRLRS